MRQQLVVILIACLAAPGIARTDDFDDQKVCAPERDAMKAADAPVKVAREYADRVKHTYDVKKGEHDIHEQAAQANPGRPLPEYWRRHRERRIQELQALWAEYTASSKKVAQLERAAAPVRSKYSGCVEQARAAFEAARKAKEAEQAALKARVEKLHADRKIMGVVLSAHVCVYRDVRSRAKGEIATEYRYARQGGGMVDKVKLYDLQEVMRKADDDAAAVRALMKEAKMRQVPCGSTQMKVLRSCFDQGTPVIYDECGAREYEDWVLAGRTLPLLGGD